MSHNNGHAWRLLEMYLQDVLFIFLFLLLMAKAKTIRSVDFLFFPRSELDS